MPSAELSQEMYSPQTLTSPNPERLSGLWPHTGIIVGLIAAYAGMADARMKNAKTVNNFIDYPLLSLYQDNTLNIKTIYLKFVIL